MYKYGWVPSLPDFRDHNFSLTLEHLPESVDLRADMPEVYDQGELGSCSGNAIAAAIRYDQLKNKNKYLFNPSRLFIYYQERAIENSINSDSGAMIRDGIKACASVGAPPEYRWAYDITKFADNPPAAAYYSASQHKIKTYEAVGQDLVALKTALAGGYPVVFGFTVYSSFESDSVAQSGIVPMPLGSDSMVGGHAVVACGYDDNKSHFIVRNSWGPEWGDKGYFYLSYDYLTNPNLSSDFWVINSTN